MNKYGSNAKIVFRAICLAAVLVSILQGILFAWGLPSLSGLLGADQGEITASGNSNTMKPAGSAIAFAASKNLTITPISNKDVPRYNSLIDGTAYLVSNGEKSLIKETFRKNGNDSVVIFSTGVDSRAMRYEDFSIDQVAQFSYYDAPSTVEFGGKTMRDVFAVKHEGPTVVKDFVVYRDTYFDREGNELGWFTVNPDGTQFDAGDGLDPAQGVLAAPAPNSIFCRVQYSKEYDGVGADLWGYQDEQDNILNPRGEPFSKDTGDPNAFTTERYQEYTSEVIKNAKSVTLYDGSEWPVAAFSYRGGAISDKGYYFRGDMIKQVNGFDGESYNWVVPSFGFYDEEQILKNDDQTILAKQFDNM